MEWRKKLEEKLEKVRPQLEKHMKHHSSNNASVSPATAGGHLLIPPMTPSSFDHHQLSHLTS